mmetsp:Transcript_29218/g.40641  ORF Transcript_29218/g.40641 Transcript_29218/m.40641 type:complete len:237 (+) Transcript_29218:251-961(+)
MISPTKNSLLVQTFTLSIRMSTNPTCVGYKIKSKFKSLNVKVKMESTNSNLRAPDLASILLQNAIVYIGMPISSAVVELLIVELLWLNKENSARPINIIINSPGVLHKNLNDELLFSNFYCLTDIVSFSNRTIGSTVIGRSYGLALLIMLCCRKKNRSSFPNASLSLSHQSYSISAIDFYTSSRKFLELRVCLETINELVLQQVNLRNDLLNNTRYFSPIEAKQIGIIDFIINSKY